ALVLGLAALGGLTMAGIRLSGKPRPPTWLAAAHGLLAGAGFALLVGFTVASGGGMLIFCAVGLFAAAAAGGMWLFLMYHLRQETLPLPLMLAHGSAALLGLALLLVTLF